MIIAKHHRPGNWRHTIGGEPPYVPAHPWPPMCQVQWGAHGIVLGTPGTTAFFEAFPELPRTFIRGEGATIAEAEADAWARWEAIVACTEHVMVNPAGYKNGLGLCKLCRMTFSGLFPPGEVCTSCGGLCWYGFDNQQRPWCQECHPAMPRELWPDHRLYQEGNEDS